MVAEIDLAPKELEFLTEHFGVDDPSKALRMATDEYIRYRKRMNLIEAPKIEIDPEVIAQMNQE